jgi:ATP-dependent Clp protease ATP-binding subunit ClpC
MPKVNVYLPDDLAAAVRDSNIAVSSVCQTALAEAVRNAGLVRSAVEAIRDPSLDPSHITRIAARLHARMTPRLRAAIRLAREAAGAGGSVETTHLLIGLLDQRDNLAVRLLHTLDVEIDDLRHAAALDGDESAAARSGRVRQPRAEQRSTEETDPPLFSELALPARLAIASALEASIDLNQSYLGCEHLLLGLLDQDSSAASGILRSFGVDWTTVRRAVATAAAGIAQARELDAATRATELDEIVRRLDAVEERLRAVGV